MSKDSTHDIDDRCEMAALLAHISRYRLTTFAVLLQQPQFHGLGAHRLRQILKTACEDGCVASAPLHFGTRYWFLTSKGAQHLRLNESRSGPLSEAAKIRAYGLLLFCCSSHKPRYRLESNEIQERFPSLGRPGMPNTYCFDPSGLGRLSLVRIDAGHGGRWDRSVASARLDVAAHLKLPACRQLIRAHRLIFTIVTVHPRKAERLVSAFKGLVELQPVQIEVIAQPELLPLVTSMPGKEDKPRIPRHGFYRSPSRSK